MKLIGIASALALAGSVVLGAQTESKSKVTVKEARTSPSPAVSSRTPAALATC